MTTWTIEESKRYDVPLLCRSHAPYVVHACKREEARARDITDRKIEKIAPREEKKRNGSPQLAERNIATKWTASPAW